MYVTEPVHSRQKNISAVAPLSISNHLSLSPSRSSAPSLLLFFFTKSEFHVAYRECRIFFNTCGRDNILTYFYFVPFFTRHVFVPPQKKEKKKYFKIVNKTLLTGQSPLDSVYLFRASHKSCIDTKRDRVDIGCV